MSRLVPSNFQGLILLDPAFGVSARDATLTTATQAGAAPGNVASPENSALDLVQGGESWEGETLTVTTFRGGDATPGPTAARVTWTGESGKSGTTARGWLPFTVATGYQRLNTQATRDATAYPGVGTPTNPHILRLASGDVLVAFQHTYLAVNYLGVVRYDAEIGGYDPSSGRYDSGSASYVWSAQDAYFWTEDAVSYSDLGSSTPQYPCLVELPSGRLLLFFLSQQSVRGGSTWWALGCAVSDDAGATWTVASANCGPYVPTSGTGSGTPYSLQVVWHGGYLTCLIAHDEGAGVSTFVHWYSVNEGATWTQIADPDNSSDEYWSPQLIACPDGSCLAIWISKIASATNIYAARKLYPSQPLKAAAFGLSPAVSTQTQFAAGQNRLGVCLGTDQTIHLLAVVKADGSYSERTRYLRFPWSVSSLSQYLVIPPPGDDYEVEPVDYADGAAGAQHPYVRACCLWGERLVAAWDSGAGGSLLQFFGGYSSLDWNGPGFGLYNPGLTTTRYGVWWDATYLPSTVAAWTVTGAGAEGSSIEQALSLDFSGGASSRVYYRVGTAGAPVFVWLRHRQDAGGSLSSSYSGVKVKSADGVFDYDIVVRFSTTGFRVVDENAGSSTIGTDVTGLTASDTRDYLISLTATGRVVVWYKAANSQVWLQGPTGNATNDSATPDANSWVGWGCQSPSTQKSTWFFLGSCADDYGPTPGSIAEPNQPRVEFGRELCLYPGYLADGRTMRAASAPALKADSWVLSPSFAYPLDALDPSVSPSPSVAWRSQDDQVEQVIEWDSTDETQLLSPALGIYLRNPNFLELVWEYWSGSAWVEIATVSTVRLSGDFERTGYVISPTGEVGSQAVARGELAGSWVVLTDGGTGDVFYRQIAHNGSGIWSEGTDDLPLQIEIEGDLTGLPTSGTIEVIAPETALVVNAGFIRASLWRVRIPARTYSDADQDFHTASALILGPYVPLGSRPAWGRAASLDPLQTITTTNNGRRRVQQLAPRGRRRAEIPFTDPGLAWDVYYATVSAGTTNTVALADTGTPTALANQPQQIEELLLAAKGALYPVVYLPALVPPGGTVTMRDLILYGRIVSATTRTMTAGVPGQIEPWTVSTLVVEEEL